VSRLEAPAPGEPGLTAAPVGHSTRANISGATELRRGRWRLGRNVCAPQGRGPYDDAQQWLLLPVDGNDVKDLCRCHRVPPTAGRNQLILDAEGQREATIPGVVDHVVTFLKQAVARENGDDLSPGREENYMALRLAWASLGDETIIMESYRDGSAFLLRCK
jgi:hypothetical protein